MKLLYTQDSTADEPIMLINKHIGYSEKDGQGVDGSLFQEELLYLDSLGKKAIQVWINSPGGSVVDGYNIYTAICDSKTKVDTYGCGVMASIAGVIFQAGRKRIMNDYSWLLYHNATGGSSSDLRTINNSIATMIASRCGKTEEEVLGMMNRTTIIRPAEAYKENLCDEVRYSSTKNMKHGSKNNITAMWEESNLILNSILKPKHKQMIKVAKRLSIQEEASEDAYILAIDSIENKYKTEVESTKQSYNEIKQKYDDVEKQLNEANKKLADAEKETTMIKATNMVESFVNIGKIKNEQESISKWTNLAVLDFEGTKAAIEDLPINKSASLIKIENRLDTENTKPENLPTSAMSLALKNRLKREGKI